MPSQIPRPFTRVAATFTAEPLAEAFAFWVEELRLPCQLDFAPYNQVLQELHQLGEGTAPSSLTLLIRVEDWLRFRKAESPAQVEQALTEAGDEFLAALKETSGRTRIPLSAIFCPASDGFAFRQLGESIEGRAQRIASDMAHVDVVKSADLLRLYPLRKVHDPVADAQGHLPYKPAFYAALGTLIARQQYAIIASPKKVLVLDADNTLWKGVVGELGPKGVDIGQPYRELQRTALRAKEAGLLLAICSKNVPKDLRDVFSQHPDMLLKEDDIVAWKVNWEAKSKNLIALAKELSLGLDSFVFIDDNPAECAEVLAQCPEVLVLQLPAPREIPTFLQHLWALDAEASSDADSERTRLYRQEHARRDFAQKTGTFADFIAGLKLEVETLAPTSDLLPRLAQLTQRTNQFNATVARFTEADAELWLGQGNNHARLFQVRDRFGDYGVTGLVMFEKAQTSLIVHNFLLSCRVLGKGVEHEMLRVLAKAAEELGCDAVDIPFVEADRNEPALRFFESNVGEFRHPLDEPCYWVYQVPREVALNVTFQPSGKAPLAEKALADADEEVESSNAVSPSPSTLLQRAATDWRDPEVLWQHIQESKTLHREMPAEAPLPQTSDETSLAELWKGLLRLDHVGVDEDFFQLGGQSILATQLCSRIAERFGKILPLSAIFEARTISEQLARLREIPLNDGIRLKAASGRGFVGPLSPAQERLWFLDRFENELPAYNIPVAFHLSGVLDIDRLQEALDAVAARHEVLRSHFPDVDGKGQQVTTENAPRIPLETVFLTSEEPSAMDEILEEFASRPFALNEEWPIRALVVKTRADEQVLALSVHHIVADGWSLEVLLSELSGFYGGAKVLEKLPLQYADYTLWQRARLEGNEFDGDVAYWKTKLKNSPEILELATDFPRPAKIGYRGAVVRATLDKPFVEAVETLASERQVTPFMLLLATYQTLLYRYSGQEDILVGCPISGRTRESLEGLVGCFVNTLVMRAAPSREKRFTDFLTEVKRDTVSAYEHQELPFDRLIDLLDLPRVQSHTPLFQAMFVLQNSPTELAFPGLDCRPQFLHNGGAKTDLVFEITPSENGYALCLEYDTALFREDTAQRLLTHFAVLLQSACKAPETPLGKLALLTPHERTALLVEPNQKALHFPPALTLHERFAKQAAATPDAVALRCDDGELSYRELDERANQLAHLLRERGVGPDVLVGICMERSLDLVVGLLGILKAGGAYLPIDLSYPPERLAFMLADAKAPVLLSQSSLTKSLPQHQAATLLIDHLELGRQAKTAPENTATPENLAYVIYTSGSTGQPKGALVTHQNVVRLFDATAPWFGFDDKDVWTLFHSYAFDFSVWELWGPLLYGGRLIVVPHLVSRSPEEFIQLLEREKVTVLNQTPSAFRQLMQAEALLPSPPALALRYVIFGGEALEMPTLEPWFIRHGDAKPRLVNMYGITETTVHVTYRPLSMQDTRGGSVIGERIPDLSIYILDPNLEPVPVGVPGELYVGGAGLARGYLNRPELTEERFIKNPFDNKGEDRLYKTGDLARFLPNYDIEYLGRIDQQVKIRGFRIELGEIEKALLRHPQVKEVAVLAREDEPGTKRLVAYLIAEGSHPVDALRRELKITLPDYMVPSHFLFLDNLPLTANGKLDRRALPAPEPERPDLGAAYVPPTSETEKRLAAIWADVLRLERVGIHDNFFELGGDSILSIQIIAKARKAGYALTPRQLFDHQTVSELAQVASVVATATESPAKPDTLKKEHFPLTPVQRWFFEQPFDNRNHWNQAFVLRLAKPLDPAMLEKALGVVVSRHDAFHLRFHETENAWKQSYTEPSNEALLRTADLSAAAEANVAKLIRSLGTATQSRLDIGHGPLLRGVYFNLGDERPHRLLIAIHHLAIDGVSWRVFLEDLETAVDALTKGEEPDFPEKTATFASWSAALESYRDDASASVPYWNALLGKVTQCPRTLGRTLEASAARHTVRLTKEETQSLLTAVPAAFGTQINDALLCALLDSFHAEMGVDTLSLDLEGHGREMINDSLDLSRSIGWFTSIFPVVLTRNSGAEVGGRLTATRDQLGEIPNRGIDYGVLRYLKPGALCEDAPRDLVFNYLGRVDQLTHDLTYFKITDEDTGPWHDPKAPRTHALEVNAFVLEEQLQVQWTFSEELHSKALVERLAGGYTDALRAIVGACKEPTPVSISIVESPVAESEDSRDYPLSPMQDLLYSWGSVRGNYLFDQWYGRLSGAMHAGQFMEAWNTALARHSLLRSGFVDGRQKVQSWSEPEWTEENWMHLTPEQQEAALRDWLRADRQRVNDLSKAPLSRFCLIRIDQEEHLLVWSLPDLQLDGWSWPIVLRDVVRIYGGGAKELSPTVPYHTYLDWLESRDPSEAERYWREALKGYSTPTPLPIQHQGPTRSLHETKRELSVAATERLQSTAKQWRTTPGALVQAAWAILLQGASNRDDVVFGSAFSGRPAELEGAMEIVGPFVNNLPIRLNGAPTMTVREFVNELQGMLFELNEFQYTPASQIQEWSELAWRHRLFESIVVYQNYQGGSDTWRFDSHLTLREFTGPIHSNFPLTLLVTPGDQLSLNLLSPEPDQAQAILQDLLTLLERLPEDGEQLLSSLRTLVTVRAIEPLAVAASANYSAPQTPLEKEIAAVWQKAFGIDRIGVEDNFFDLGGHSLLMTRVHAALASSLEQPVSLVEMFRFPTIRAFAQHLDPQAPAPSAGPEVVAVATPLAATEGIAIIGMAGRFPGAEDIDAFWANLTKGLETIETFDLENVDPSEPKEEPDYVPRRGVLKDPFHFDAAFFGMSPKEAEVTDPQQRVFLEMAWLAMEHAGYDAQRTPGAVGVFAGMSNNSYYLRHVHHHQELRDLVGSEMVMIGNEKDYLTTRVAYKLNLHGPTLNVYTACSTSLVAVCQAVRALLAGQCEMALAGGISLKVPQERGYVYEEGSLFSPDGHCRAFDEQARGTVFSNGGGVVVLKPLSAAQRDGDQIYAVIRGTGLNNDGSGKVSFTAPSVDGQAEAIAMAHREAGVSADTISYVESHGTGTPLGDPIEVAGLTKAFRQTTDREHFCGLGSLKTSIGHLDAAAGVGGLIKAALALHHRKIPATLHYNRPNPELHLESSPFYIVDTLTDWPEGDTPRRAGVSSLGIGGANAHVLLEEAPEMAVSGPSRNTSLLLLSAKTPSALAKQRALLAEHLKEQPARSLADVAYTLAKGRQIFRHRAALTAGSADEAVAKLLDESNKDVLYREQDQREKPVYFLFPGQGSQHPGMGAGLYASEPVFREVVDHCCAVLEPVLQVDLRELLYRQDDAAILKETRITQPALFVTEYAMARLWMSWGIQPKAMIGHSVGEYVAGCLAGVFTLDEALVLVAKRAQLVQAQPAGAMLAIRSAEADVLPLLGEQVNVAAVNALHSTVVAGPFEAIEALQEALKEKGIACKALATSHAFHSHMMDPVVAPFTELLRQIDLKSPTIPYVSNVSGEWITAEQTQDPAYWASHVRDTVRFADGVGKLLDDAEGILLEVGPGTTLANFTKQHAKCSKVHRVIASVATNQDARDEEPALLHKALGQLWLDSAVIDWNGYFAGQTRRRVALPTYPFERQFFCPPAVTEAESLRVPEVRERSGSASSTAALGERSGSASSTAAEPLRVPSPSEPVDRKGTLVREIQHQFHELSGIDTDDLDPEAAFLDLGFDSLFLTQAALVLKKHFGTKVTFRQLMEEQTSIGALASHLDATLPSGKFAPAPVATALPTPVAVEVATTPMFLPNPNPNTVEGRLQVLENALRELQNKGLLGAFQGPVPAPVPPPIAGSSSSRPIIRVKQQDSAPEKKMAFGPFRPIEMGDSGGLTDQQQEHLNALIAAYTAKTRGTKALIAEQRPILADPRAAAGFNPRWKEMVYPLMTDRSDGGKVWDVDGNEYIDVTLGFGLNLLGHRPPFVMKAIHDQLGKGMEIGPSTPLAGDVAKLILEFSGMERVSFCNTGSEAVTAALRVARTVSGRDLIAMFTGDYHGIFDEVLVRPLVVKGELRSKPIAPGIVNDMVNNVIVLEYGNPESLEIIREHADELAAVLVEPVQSRRPDLVPIEFLKEIREITQQSETALIFDEVVTGFRSHPGGTQALFGIQADLVTYGKVIGGGLPIGIVAGKRRYMDALDGGKWQFGDDSFPEVGVTFFAGTFIRHPLALAAAKAVLVHLKESGPALQATLDEKTKGLVDRMNAIAEVRGVPIKITRFSSLYFINTAPELKFASLLFYHMRLRGIHIWETRGSFLCTRHTDEEIARIAEVFEESIVALQEGGFFPGGGEGERSAAISVTSNQCDESFPLSASQEELFLSARMSDEAALAGIESITFTLRGRLEEEVLRSAIQSLVARRDNLRTIMVEDGTSQRVLPKAEVELRAQDLSALNDQERVARYEALVTAELSVPFDLTVGPMVRASLFQWAENEWRLIFTAPHLICDGWSFEIIANELPALYEREVRGAAAPALSPAPSYREFVEDEHRHLASEEFDETKRFWLDQFRSMPPRLDLPTDRPRTAEKSHRAGTVNRALPAATVGDLQGFAKKHGVTPYVVLLGLYQCLVSRLSGERDVVIGTPVAGQVATGHQNVCGHCVRFLPLRLEVKAEESVDAFLKRVKGASLDTLEHQDFTLGHLTKLREHTETDVQPSFVTTTFTLEAVGKARERAGLSWEADVTERRYSGFELSLFVVIGGDYCRIMAVYHRDLFDRDTIERWLGHYETMLVDLLSGGLDRPLDALAWMSDREKEQILSNWSGAMPSKAPPLPINRIFEAVVEKTPKAVALVQGTTPLSYDEVNRRANAWAHRLRELGVGRGDRVAVLMPRQLDTPILLLAILKAGGAYVPIDPNYPAERVRFILEDTGAKVMLSKTSVLEQQPRGGIAGVKVELVDRPLPGASQTAVENVLCGCGSEDLAYVIYTSGSTGKPKGSMISHRGVVRLVKETDYASFGRDEVFLLASSLSFDASTFEIWGALLNGGTLALPESETPSLEDLEEAIKRHQVTTLWLTAGLFQLMVDERLDALRPLKQLLTGGDVLPLAHVRKAFQALSCRLINGYGPTENTTFTCCHTIREGDLEGVSIPIGKPIAGTSIYILGESLRPVPIGVRGELYIGGEGLTKGYVNRPDLDQAKLVPNPFSSDPASRLYRSGDQCRWLADGVVEFFGRLDTQIKIRGFRIEPGEIEAVMAEHPQVRQAVVVARGESAGDKTLHAYCVVESGAAISPSELRDYMNDRLPDYLMPSVIQVLDELPVTANGKVDYRALPVAKETTFSHVTDSFVAPSTPLQGMIAQLWSEALGVERPSIDDHFFRSGGHSLLGLKLFTRIQKETGVALPLATLFRAPTIRQLAAIVEKAKGPIPKVSQNGHGVHVERHDELPSTLAALQPHGELAPIFCVHGGDGGTLFYKSLADRLPVDRAFYAIEAPMLLDAALIHDDEDVEGIAAKYLAQIRAERPDGPLILGGYSFGGVVAYEMAQQALAAGGEIERLLLFDTPNPAMEATMRFNLAQRAAANWRLNQDKSITRRIGGLAGRMSRGMVNKINHQRQVRRALDMLETGEEAPEDIRVVQVREMHTKIVERYQPLPYAGSMVLFRAASPTDFADYSLELGWEGLVKGGITVINVPGQHLDIFEEPNIGVLADELQAILADGESRRSLAS